MFMNHSEERTTDRLLCILQADRKELVTTRFGVELGYKDLPRAPNASDNFLLGKTSFSITAFARGVSGWTTYREGFAIGFVYSCPIYQLVNQREFTDNERHDEKVCQDHVCKVMYAMLETKIDINARLGTEVL
jgi:hypothetical protein